VLPRAKVLRLVPPDPLPPLDRQQPPHRRHGQDDRNHIPPQERHDRASAANPKWREKGLAEVISKRTAVWLVGLWLPFGGAMAADAPPGASSCSGCHPLSQSVDTPVARLIGRNPADIVTAMQAFRSGQRSGTIMDRIAKGFTDDETKAIADWYGAQK